MLFLKNDIRSTVCLFTENNVLAGKFQQLVKNKKQSFLALEVSRKAKPSAERLEAEAADALDRRQFCFVALLGFQRGQ